VSASNLPNTTDGVHSNNAFEDTMCGLDAPQLINGPFNGLYFDRDNDDSWDPPHGAPLGWWTVNLSRFICPDAHCNRPVAAVDTRARAARDRAVPTIKHPRTRGEKRRRKGRPRGGWRQGPRPARVGSLQ